MMTATPIDYLRGKAASGEAADGGVTFEVTYIQHNLSRLLGNIWQTPDLRAVIP